MTELLARLLRDAGVISPVHSARRLGGGSINQAACVVLDDGMKLFVKSNDVSHAGMMRAERAGLIALGQAGARVPRIIAYGEDSRHQVLVLEYIESGSRTGTFYRSAAETLAQLHGTPVEYTYGFESDNYIGSTPQRNAPRSMWGEFFRDMRILPQVAFARERGHLSAADIRLLESLADRIPSLLPEPDRPALLHGDLWGGNSLAGMDGNAWLIDPAVYRGAREADLAMTELFGGYDRSFYDTYHALLPLPDSYHDVRDLYNLYHVLNHLNLFGSGYYHQAMSIVRRYA
jgi:protein-ribulosamine 3-kinase